MRAFGKWPKMATMQRLFSATKSSGVLGTSMAALGLAIAWVDSELSFSINKMESVVTNVNSSDILTESDIPGALLPVSYTHLTLPTKLEV